MTPINSFYALICLFVLFNADNALAQVQEHTSLGEADDCTNIAVDYANNPNLTQQEKIELMDKALFHSLNKYEGCRNSRARNAGGGKAGDRGADGTQAGAGSNAGNGKSKSSTASSEMSGTQAPAAQEASTGSSSTTAMTTWPS